MFVEMTKTYKVGKLVESLIDKVNSGNDFNVKLDVVDDNTMTITVKKFGMEPENNTRTVIVRR